MIFALVIAVTIFLWLIRRQWKIRRILKLSRILRTKYRSWPIVGHGLMFLGNAEDRMKTFQKFGREAIESEHGMISAWLGTRLCIVTCDAMVIEMVTKSCLGKTDVIIKIARHLLGNASVFAPVNIWRPRRKVLAPVFSPKNIRASLKIFVEQSIILTDCLKPKVGNGAFSIWDTFTSYTMDTVCQSTFGIEVNAQKQSSHPLLSAIAKYLAIIPVRLIQPSRYMEWLFKFLPTYKETEDLKTVIHDFVNDMLKKQRTLLENERTSDTSRHKSINNFENSAWNMTFLEQLKILSRGSYENNGYTDLELLEESLTLLIPGIDTSSAASSFTTLMLSRHLDVQEKAYEEIHNIFGNSKRPITYEDLSKLKYIEAVIKETLRIFPPIPILMRENDIDIKLASGITIPADTYTVLNIWALHRNPRYWGSDAEQFKPDRFMNGPPVDRTMYIPFSHGPRDCLGYQYAMMSLKVVITTLIRYYKVLPPTDISSEDLKKPLRLEFKVAIKDVDNFQIRLEYRT